MDSICINEKTLDIPDQSDIRKWDVGCDGSNKILWLDGFKRDFKNCVFERESHKLERTSRGRLTIDDEKVVSGSQEGLKLFEIFGKLYQKPK